ncbi:MAG: hypothetical protein AB7V58_05570 [Solirubrobacterales bacterium]
MIQVAAATPLVALNLLATSIWAGGLVAIFVVARVAAATLEPAQRIAFFRGLGRAYGIIGSAALLLALVTGAILLAGHPWDGLLVAALLLAGALLVFTVAGMAQARAMSRLRSQALTTPDLADRVGREARVAAGLRGAIAAFTLALLVVGAALAQ